MEILLLLLLIELITVSVTFSLKKFLELKVLKRLFDAGKKRLDDDGLLSRIIIDLKGDMFIPLLNLFEVSFLAINFDNMVSMWIDNTDDDLFDLLPLEREVYEENPSYLTLLMLNRKLYKRLIGMPLSKMTNLQNDSVTYFKRLEDGDVKVLYSSGKDARLGEHVLHNKIIGESEVVNQAISEKYDNIDDFVHDAKSGLIDLDEKEDVSNIQNTKDYLQALRKSLMSENSINEESDPSTSPKQKVLTKDKKN